MIGLFGVLAWQSADVITLTGSNSYEVGPDEVAEVISLSDSGTASAYCLVNNYGVVAAKYPSGGASMLSLLPMTIAGPRYTIRARDDLGSDGAFVTIRVQAKEDYLAPLKLPAIGSAVVIPETLPDSARVEVFMEFSFEPQGPWTIANPGLYKGDLQPIRFFRLRAVLQD
jgi:hypothetical protein